MSATDTYVMVPEQDPLKEADRIMQICNACRYCEGFCAVFPAMTRRLTFNEGDLNYLANLCHNCGACYYACQYAPPHPFQVNVPETFAKLRVETYKNYAWPAVLGRLYDSNAMAVALTTALALSAFIFGLFAMVSPERIWAVHTSSGSFYSIMSHSAMVSLFGGVALFVVLAWVIGFTRFWRDTGETIADFAAPRTFGQALWDVLTLKYLDGGGDGCTYPDEKPSFTRRNFHHFTFYGFMLCFAATTAGTIFHYGFGWVAPYSNLSLPKVLGTLGGLGLIIGPAGLMALKFRAEAAVSAQAHRGMDMGFLVLLMLTSLTGFALMLFRDTPAMALLLAVHLGVVLGFFLMLPYGKFVHAIYRLAALVRYALERSRPNPAASFE